MEIFLDSYGKEIQQNDLLRIYFIDKIKKEPIVEEITVIVKLFNKEFYGICFKDENNLNHILSIFNQNGLNSDLLQYIQIATLIQDEHLFEIKHITH